jgi:signal transduction histidine kinase
MMRTPRTDILNIYRECIVPCCSCSCCHHTTEKTDPSDLDKMDTFSDVTAACKKAVEILNDLLCFDMLESGILELHKQEIAVLPFLYNIQLFSTQARGIGVDLTVAAGTIDIGSHSPGIALLLADSWVARPLHSEDCMYVDKFKMDQVIRNLISNALKFTPRGGSVCVTATFVPEYVERFKSNKSRKHSEFPRNPTSSRESSSKMMAKKGSSNHFSFRRVYVEEPAAVAESIGSKFLPRSIETVAGKLVVVVRDTGAGISAINQKRLFNEICQFNPEILQAGGGSGLGLWITRWIVDLHDSTISVYSAGEGRGCIFTLEIPMMRRNPTPDQPLGPGATSRRASGDQDEKFAFRKSERWRYLIRQLGE